MTENGKTVGDSATHRRQFGIVSLMMVVAIVAAALSTIIEANSYDSSKLNIYLAFKCFLLFPATIGLFVLPIHGWKKGFWPVYYYSLVALMILCFLLIFGVSALAFLIWIASLFEDNP